MPCCRNLLTRPLAIFGVMAGLSVVSFLCVGSAEAQSRISAAQRNREAASTVTLRSRADVQAQSPAEPGMTQNSSTRYAASSAWPGPQSPAQRPQFATSNGLTSSSGQIQQTSANDRLELLPTGPFIVGSHRKRIRDYSWIYIDPPQPQEIKLHDIVTIIVDEKSEVIMNSKFNRQRTSKLKAELREFVRIGETGNLVPAALNGPTVDSQLQGTLNSTGQLTDQEGIKYRIAATVVDVLPNGVLQLEARKVIQTQDDVSEYRLTGELRAADISPDNTASSENVASLNIVKQQNGRVYDATKRNWGYRLYDWLSPF
ncbi:MAG: flagellar basal body L-ring protein FlgH [Planctomycetota bacterium]|nr:flagellar basal body L-ring protein FlgH [Planctomycetota bacterium]